MPENQKAIYYLAAESLKNAKSAPFLEKLVQKDVEVSCYDPLLLGLRIPWYGPIDSSPLTRVTLSLDVLSNFDCIL
ncbi:hypothetical protein Pyn_23398 [Prunus yedoensis var. nudiflora]|uniref:Uncharacterized protein n=1 Tax=Prunus yedoensis var. nudiflora TaxID=2094558 RepID=A0A314ZHS5_PRUYE|nr:hypothetical protein Pyn_23398 [Prunus yedoensis var. nudiflora]